MVRRFVVLIFLVISELFSCGPSPVIEDFLKDNYYNFLPAKLLKIDTQNPLFNHSCISSGAFDSRVNYYNLKKKKLNLIQWSKELKVSQKLVEDILYHAKSNTIDNIEFKTYLDFLKRFNKNFDIYNEKPTNAPLKEAKNLFHNAKTDFYRLRYAYNIIRGYHYLKEYKKELEFIKTIQPLKIQNDLVWEWIESLKAGAMQQLGDIVGSAYLCATNFATHKSDAFIGYYDFKITSDDEWSKLLQRAKNSDQKLVFYLLRGVKQGNHLLEEYQQMLKIDQNSKWTKIAKYMLAQKAQYKIFNKSTNYKLFLNTFLTVIKSKDNLDKFDNYILEYFALLNEDKKPLFSDNRYQTLLDYIYYIKNLKKIDEDKISKSLNNLKDIASESFEKDAFDYTIVKLEKLYPDKSIKKYLIWQINDYQVYNIKRFLDLKTIKEYKDLVAKKEKNHFEKLLLKKAYFTLTKEEEDVFKAIIYTSKGMFKTAYNLIKDKKDAKNYMDYYDNTLKRVSSANPFNNLLSGDNRRDKIKIYPFKKFLKIMIELKSKTTAMDYYLRGIGWYNISDFGNAPMFATIHRFTTIVSNDDEANLFKLNKAKIFFNTSLKKGANKELKAKIYYQLMKIDMAYALMTHDDYKVEFGSAEIVKLLKKSISYKLHLQKLREYKDTKFFNKIKGCATFKYFK